MINKTASNAFFFFFKHCGILAFSNAEANPRINEEESPEAVVTYTSLQQRVKEMNQSPNGRRGENQRS